MFKVNLKFNYNVDERFNRGKMAIDCFIKRKITKFYQNLVIFYTLFILK